MSLPQATAVGAKEPGTKRLYELTFGAKNRVSSRRPASWPAMKRWKSASSSAKTLPPPSFWSEQWMWHELPSRSLNLAMKVIAMPSWSAISLAPVL